MNSHTSRRFREAFLNLLENVQARARQAYRLFRQNPAHPSLNFKKVDADNNVYSVRIGMGYRALGKMDGADIVWFWIGPHSEYDKRV
jgi:hypothetical protein